MICWNCTWHINVLYVRLKVQNVEPVPETWNLHGQFFSIQSMWFIYRTDVIRMEMSNNNQQKIACDKDFTDEYCCWFMALFSPYLYVWYYIPNVKCLTWWVCVWVPGTTHLDFTEYSNTEKSLFDMNISIQKWGLCWYVEALLPLVRW